MRLLIADDDPVSRQLLHSTLRRLGHEVTVCEDGTAALTELSRPGAPRLAILDWMMPGADGLEVCRTLRRRPGAYVYAILLTARDSRADLLQALEAEADDFLTKPFDPMELRLRLRAGERVLAVQERLLESQDALRFEASHDRLTGLWNRGAIMDQLARELNRVRHHSPPLGVMIADLDHFKLVNDTHGHLVGDEVLRQVAARMGAQLRSSDTLGRYGGEEFLLLAPGADAAGVLEVAERVRAAVAATPIEARGQRIEARISVGAVSSLTGREDPDVLVRCADDALYQAKQAGRNRVVGYGLPQPSDVAPATSSDAA